MDMAALFADISVGLSAQYGGPYHAGTIVTQGTPTTGAGGAIITPGTPVERACSVMVDNATEAMRVQEGYTDEDRRMLVLTAGVTGEIGTDDTIIITAGPYSGEWMVGSVSRDPFGSYFELRARRA